MQWDIFGMKDGRVLVVSDRAELPPGWREDYRSCCTVNRPEDMPPDPEDTSTWDHYPLPPWRRYSVSAVEPDDDRREQEEYDHPERFISSGTWEDELE